MLTATGCQEMGGDPNARSAADAGMVSPLLPVARCTDLSDADKAARDMIEAINAERAKRDLKPLRTSASLMQVADFYACRLVDGRFFDHEDPFDGSTVDTRATDFGYAFYQIGENLAAQQPSVADAMASLMRSPTHRANILDPVYTEIGVAVKLGGEHGIYWVQEFGRPISDDLPTPSELRPAKSGAPTTLPADRDEPAPIRSTTQSAG